MSIFASGHKYHFLTALLFAGLSLWWIIVSQDAYSSDHRQLFAATYGIMALWGAVWGLKTAQAWGGLQSLFGKAILMFTVGLFLQEFGQIAYSYYIYYRHLEVPYPSIGDIGYFGSIPFYAYGAYLLAQTSGIKFAIQSSMDKLKVVFFPTALLVFSFALFLRGYEFDLSNLLVIFLDFGYPLGQAMYISIALLTYVLCRRVLGGVMRPRILLIIVAFILQYLADFTFLYQNSLGTWEVGRINDYMYLIAYTAMTLALLELRHVIVRIRTSG